MQLSSKPFTGVILGGGKSIRMKTNKCLISLNDKKLIEILIDRLKEIFEEIFIVTNLPEIYFYTGIHLLGDIYPFKGPMAGIHVALKNSNYDIFAFACDMPFVKKEIIHTLSEEHLLKGKPVTVVLFQGKIYPLPGIYSKKLKEKLENLIKDDKLSLMKLLQEVDYQIIDIANLDPEGLSLININTEQDLVSLKEGGKK